MDRKTVIDRSKTKQPDWDCAGLSDEEIWEKIREGERAIREGRYITFEEWERKLDERRTREFRGRRVCATES